MFLSWENDRVASRVALHHFPNIWPRGDLDYDDLADIPDEIMKLDPEGHCLILIIGAAPCMDFTGIRGQNSPGTSGPEGAKFDKALDKVDWLKGKLSSTHYITTVWENVVPADHLAHIVPHFNKRTESQAVVVDAADHGWIGRPRLWWINSDWDKIESLTKQ